MPDPVTIGLLVSSALSAGAVEAGKGLLGAAARDAYDALRSGLVGLFGTDAEAAADNPDSKGRAIVLAEHVDTAPAADREQLHALAEALRSALDSEGRASALTQTFNQFNNTGSGTQFNAPGGTQNFGADFLAKKPTP